MPNVLVAVVEVVGGFAFLLMGGEFLLKAAISLSVRAKVSPYIIALTVIAGGTSAPELVTSLIASSQNATDIVVGNVVGSNIFNILAIIGVAGLIKPSSNDGESARRDAFFLLIITGIFLLLGKDGLIGIWQGLLFSLSLCGYFTFAIIKSRKALKREKEALLELEGIEDVKTTKNIFVDLFLLTLGFGSLIGGADLALEGAQEIGRLMGLTERVIGLTIVSAGTGLPELAMSAVAAYRGRDDIAISNIIGSNIINTLGVIGITSIFYPISFIVNNFKSDGIWLIGSTVLILLLVLPKIAKITRGRSLIFFGLYCTYIYSLF